MLLFAHTVPSLYFSPTDDNGKRRDHDERVELTNGSVQFLAPPEYMVRPPVPPVYMFVLDVSYAAASSGMLHVAAEAIRQTLKDLPGGDRTQIAFITYDANVHFYVLNKEAASPQMLVVPEVSDLFLPAPEDLLVNAREAESQIDALLDSLPRMHANTHAVESCLGAALEAAYMLMQHVGGKMLVFQATLPSVGNGKLRQREAPRMLGTDQVSLSFLHV